MAPSATFLQQLETRVTNGLSCKELALDDVATPANLTKVINQNSFVEIDNLPVLNPRRDVKTAVRGSMLNRG